MFLGVCRGSGFLRPLLGFSRGAWRSGSHGEYTGRKEGISQPENQEDRTILYEASQPFFETKGLVGELQGGEGGGGTRLRRRSGLRGGA